MSLPQFCMYCHEPLDRMLLLALLADLGCKGSCEHVAECYNSEDGQHYLITKDDVDKWIVKLNGGQHDFPVWVPKGTSLTKVWSHAWQQHPGCTISSIRKSRIQSSVTKVNENGL